MRAGGHEGDVSLQSCIGPQSMWLRYFVACRHLTRGTMVMQVPLVRPGPQESGLVGRHLLHCGRRPVLDRCSVDHDQRLPQQPHGT